MQPNIRTVVLSLAAVTALNAPALACTVRKSGASALARIQQIGATEWRLSFPGYTTGAVAGGTIAFCAGGLSVPTGGPITSVDSLSMYMDANSGSMLQFSWKNDAKIAENLNTAQPGNWTGFFGRATGAIPAGIDHILTFDVTVAGGTTPAQMIDAVKKCVVGTDDSNAVRSLRGTNRFFLIPTNVVLDDCVRNEKTFHNTRHSTSAARIKGTSENFVYWMQPHLFRKGQGDATGWQGAFQDEDAATAETVQMGFVRYANDDMSPDLSSGGMITNVQFKIFGAGTGKSAAIWRLTTTTKMPLPHHSGIRMVLGRPAAWPTDGLTVHLQDGATTKIPEALRKPWAFGRSSSTPIAWGAPGSTIHMGALYDSPVTHGFVRSSAYGSDEDLFGPEALHPDSTRGDRIGFRVVATSYANQFALLMSSGNYRAAPLDSPLGFVLIENFLMAGLMPLDGKGIGTSPVVPVPGGLHFATQSALFDMKTLNIEFSDATKFISQ